eukprot:6197146-Heterocapsa_arctica.AAC.1
MAALAPAETDACHKSRKDAAVLLRAQKRHVPGTPAAGKAVLLRGTTWRLPSICQIPCTGKKVSSMKISRRSAAGTRVTKSAADLMPVCSSTKNSDSGTPNLYPG